MDKKLTEGRPLSVILKFMLPLMVGNIFQQLYNLVDTVIVGKYVGPQALAAVGSTGTIMFFIIGTCAGMVTGFSIITSQKYGSEDHDGVKRSFTNGLILSVILIIISTAVTVLLIRQILKLMNTPEDIFEMAYDYISVICWGIFATVLYNFFSALLRAIGNSTVPLISLVMSAALNVGLDLLLIARFNMGTAGAAYATIISQAVSAIFCIIYILCRVEVLTPGRQHWKPNRYVMHSELMQGIPMALQTGITASGTMIMQSAFNLFGSVAVAGVTAASKIQGITTQAMFTIGQTMSSYVGQNFGKEDFKRIRDGVKASLKIFIVYSIGAGVVTYLALPAILPVFFDQGTDIGLYLPWARTYILECTTCYFFLSMIFIYRSSIQAMGHGFLATVMGVSELTARVCASFTSMYFRSFYIAVAADPFAWVVAALIGCIMFYRLLPRYEKKQGNS